LRAHRAQGAGLAMGRRGAVRRVVCVSRLARALALHRRDARGEAADGGGGVADGGGVVIGQADNAPYWTLRSFPRTWESSSCAAMHALAALDPGFRRGERSVASVCYAAFFFPGAKRP